MTLEDDISLLSQVSFFREFDTDMLRLIAFAAEQREISVGGVLFRQGEMSDGGFVVARGSFALTEGNSDVARRVALRGALLGELALISETRRPVTATAREAAMVLRLSRAMFRRMLAEYPQLGQALHASLRQRVQRLSGDLRSMKVRFREPGAP